MNLCESKLAGFDKNLKEYEQKQSEEINIKIKEIDKKIEELMNGPKQSIDYFQRQYYELNSDKMLLYSELMSSYITSRNNTGAVELIKQADDMYNSIPATIKPDWATSPIEINKNLLNYANVNYSFLMLMEEYGNNVRSYEDG